MLIKGLAETWKQTTVMGFYATTPPNFRTWGEFCEKFIEAFKPISGATTAATDISNMKQTEDAQEYVS